MNLVLKTNFLILFFFLVINATKAVPQSTSDSKYFHIIEIVIKGNEKTKTDVILRELTFSNDDSIESIDINKRLKESQYNLMNTHLFNFVTLSYIELEPLKIRVTILLQERWYFFPYPILEQADRNFATWLNSHNWERINIGLHLKQYNFRGRDETVSIKFRKGYREQYAFAYNNIHLDNTKKNLLNFEASLFRQSEVAYKLYENRLQYFSSSDKKMFVNNYLSVNYIYRPHINNFHYFTFTYEYYKIADTVLLLNDNYLNKSNVLTYFSFEYKFVQENRDLAIFPLTGSYFDFSIKQNGFNLLKNSISYYQISLQYEYYKNIIKRHYWSSVLKIAKTKNIQLPFILNNALGYNYYLYGFEDFVINGNDFVLYKTEWRYEMIKPRLFYIPYLNNEKFSKAFYSFYLHLFMNAGYVNNLYSTGYNKMENNLLTSLGAGIDFFTYYDKVIRFDYSWNKYAGSNFFVTLVYNNK
ncbi:MAG: hypothetical protein GXO79_15300 [Chlorobi bacterium]|nr:hypothetical protein [Chlorobiota bacterium]